METLKLKLTLLGEPVAVPDSGNFTNSTSNASYSILAVLAIIAVLALVTYLVVKNIRKNKKLNCKAVILN